MKQVLSVLAVAAAMGLAGPAFAQTYRANLTGPGEAPPNSSPGTSMVTIDLSGTNLTIDAPFRDLVAPTTVAHIHCCTTQAFNGAAPPAIGLADFPVGVQSGTYSHSYSLSDTATYEPAFLAANGGTASSAASALVNAMNANEAYVNIHSSAYPNGEIRGFLVAAPIPEPAEWMLLAGGLLSLWWMGSRRSRPGPGCLPNAAQDLVTELLTELLPESPSDLFLPDRLPTPPAAYP